MKRKIVTVISLILSFTSLFVLLSPSAGALKYSGSDSYKSGPYYEKLCAVERTGDLRTDIVNIARSQVGYFEGSNSSQLSGTVNGTKNYTEYGKWYGMQDMWCAIFVSWCAYVANVSESVVPKHAYTPSGLSWFQNKGQAYSRADVAAGKYTPEPGDIVYFKSSRNNNPTNHVGILADYSNRTITTVEGNSSLVGIDTNGGAVAEKQHSIDDTYIVYICRPSYEVGPSCPDIMVQIDEYGASKKGVKVRGWCFDKRDNDIALQIHVYIGGPIGDPNAEKHTETVANASRPDVNNVHKCGNNHGYDAVIQTELYKKQPVYVYAYNPETEDIAFISTFTTDIPVTKLKKGDINIDCSVDNKDVVELFRYVTKIFDSEADSSYDFNEDGKVNNKDVTMLFRYINSN